MMETQKRKITLNFFEPYKAQKPILRACLDPAIKYVCYNASRQSGKSLMLSNLAVYYALDKSDQSVMVVSPIDSQVRKLYRQILNSIIHLPFIKSYKIQSGDAEICFTNGSVILFRSAASTNSLRGYTNTHLLLDEAAYISSDVWSAILAPTLLVRGKKAIFCSTPFGKNWFFKLYMEGLTNPEYRSFKTTYEQNPYANKGFIEGQRKTLPEEIFRQEYEGSFTDSSNLFKDVEKHTILNEIIGPIKGDTYFAGVDVAFKKDYTVVSIFNNRKEMVFIDRFNNTTNEEILKRISAALIRFKVTKCFVESNSFGIAIIEQLIKNGSWMVEGFTTTATSKPLIINDLIYAFNNGELKLLNNEALKGEFLAFGYSLSKGGNIKYQASYGTDDIVMSVAIAYYCLRNNLYAGSFIFS